LYGILCGAFTPSSCVVLSASRVFPRRNHCGTSGSRNVPCESGNIPFISIAMILVRDMVNMNLLHDLSKARGGRSDSVAPNHYRAISGCCPDSSRSCPSPFSLLGARDSPRGGDSEATHALQNQHYHMALIDRVHDVDRVITFLDDKVDGLRKVQRLKDGVTSTRWLQPSNEPPKPKSIDQDSRRAYRLQGSVVERSSSMIEDYKKSAGFEMGLVRIGQVSLEYDYLLALARFRARYLDLKVKEEPFKKLRKDVNVLMVKSSLSVTRRRLRRVE
ncbi:hypothetical protein GW17_00003573, partial [Ensete ventricosum]